MLLFCEVNTLLLRWVSYSLNISIITAYTVYLQTSHTMNQASRAFEASEVNQEPTESQKDSTHEARLRKMTFYANISIQLHGRLDPTQWNDVDLGGMIRDKYGPDTQIARIKRTPPDPNRWQVVINPDIFRLNPNLTAWPRPDDGLVRSSAQVEESGIAVSRSGSEANPFDMDELSSEEEPLTIQPLTVQQRRRQDARELAARMAALHQRSRELEDLRSEDDDNEDEDEDGLDSQISIPESGLMSFGPRTSKRDYSRKVVPDAWLDQVSKFSAKYLAQREKITVSAVGGRTLKAAYIIARRDRRWVRDVLLNIQVKQLEYGVIPNKRSFIIQANKRATCRMARAKGRKLE